MKQYLKLLKKVLTKGELRPTPKKFKALSIFGAKMEFNLKSKFPIITTKKISFVNILEELLWFISGDTNIRTLNKKGVKIWNLDAYNFYTLKQNKTLTYDEYLKQIMTNDKFAQKYGDLGPIYGKQWNNFGGINQLNKIIKELGNKKTCFSRRHLISSWNVGELSQMALPPCHVLAQFYVTKNNFLHCQLYQRSGDLFLGIPYNISSYSLLTIMIAKVLNYKPGKFIHIIGDCHLYINHLTQAKTQLLREPKPLPTLLIKKQKNIYDFKNTDFVLLNYAYHPFLKGDLSV